MPWKTKNRRGSRADAAAARRFGARSSSALVIPALVLAGCTMYRYQPVEQREIEDLAERGCEKGERVMVLAEVNQVYEDSLVLWDGRDPETTYTLQIEGPGLGRKAKSLVGQSRYERAYDALQDVMEDDRRVEATFTCRGERRTPIATRIAFRDLGGDEIAYEF